MRLFYTDHFVLPLPEGHRFPMGKYALLRARLVDEGVVDPSQLFVPAAASREQLLRVHDAAYVERVFTGTLADQEVRRIGFPWSSEMVERSRRSVGATVEAAHAALDDGVAVNLAGGTHHSFADAGEGFCVFNDAAVAIRDLQAAGRIRRAVVIDTDVHQGNGTASIFAGDASVFTFSIHGQKNFPLRKTKSDLDIALKDGMGDGAYLDALSRGLRFALGRAKAEFAVFVSGADPYRGDRLGRLSLSKEGLRLRDEMVMEACRTTGLPVAVTMAGGYSPALDDIVDIHVQTIDVAQRYFMPASLT